MNFRSAISMATVVASGLLAACTPGLEDYPRELEEAICEWQQGCHLYERRSDCIDALAIDRDVKFDYLVEAVAAGRIEYDREAAADCFDAIRERDCVNTDPGEEPACKAALRGRMGRNGPCMLSAECAEGGVCGFDPSCSEQCCVGACRVRADPLELGEACGGSIECAEGGYCGFDPGGAQVCLARVKVGGDCSIGQTCAEGSDCDGAVCRATTVAKEGERCDGRAICEPSAYCVFEGGETPVCRIPPQLGAPCDPQGIGCARFDTVCDEASRLCVLLPVPGAGCPDYRCANYATCQNLIPDEPPTCVALGTAGSSCGPQGDEGGYIDCLGDLECIDDTCVLPEVEPGSKCPVPEG